MAAPLPLRRGHVLTADALNRRGWTLYRFAEAMGKRYPTAARILNRERGVGLDLAADIARTLSNEVPVAAWSPDAVATPEEEAAFERDMEQIRRRGRERLHSPEAP